MYVCIYSIFSAGASGSRTPRLGCCARGGLGRRPEAACVDLDRSSRTPESLSGELSRSLRPLETVEPPIWSDSSVISGDLGSCEVLRLSAGAVRGALSTKFNFFASATALGSILPLPRPLWGALWRFLGALWGVWVALGATLVGSMGALGASSGVSWNGLGCSGRLLRLIWE